MTSPARCALVTIALAACDVGGEEPTDRASAPVVVRVTWDDGTLDQPVDDGPVEVWAPIDVWFDGFLDPDSVSATSVRIESNEQVVRAAVLYDPLDRRVRLTPNRTLDPTLDYAVVVTGIRSYGGASIAGSSHPFTTAAASADPRPEPTSVGWANAEPIVRRCGGASCHGDSLTFPDSAAPELYRAAVGMELEEPETIASTAIDVRAHQWPRFARIEPGRPDRSYVVYKVVDFAEEVIVGNVMPTQNERGRGIDGLSGNVDPGACCPLDALPDVHPPPWAIPGRFDPETPEYFRNRSLERLEPAVFDCACVDARGRFQQPDGPCAVVEGDCDDGLDDDDDGRTDCEDANCHFAEECPHEVDCFDGDDDDDDGPADCADPDCAGSELCEDAPDRAAIEAECDDELDDDEDGRVDCDDFDCAFERDCLEGQVAPTAESVAYCRARVLSDWVLEGASFGPGRDVCAQLCAAGCDGQGTFPDCVADCVRGERDADAIACFEDALHARLGEELPDIRPGTGLYDVETADCTTACDGETAVQCVPAEAGGECAETCATACEPIGPLCDDIAACGLGT